MAKHTLKEKSRLAREHLMSLPELPAFLEDDINTSKQDLLTFLTEFNYQPMRWGMAPFEDLVRPYQERYDLAWRRAEDYLKTPEKQLTGGLALLALKEFKDIAIKDAISELNRSSAQARHSATNQQKAAALADWETEGHKFSSMRAFARECFKRYGVTDFMTVYNWLREHSKPKA